MLNCNIMEYWVCVRALKKSTIMEIKIHYEWVGDTVECVRINSTYFNI